VPAGTGLRKYEDLIVGKKSELDEEEEEVAKVFEQLSAGDGDGEVQQAADVEGDES